MGLALQRVASDVAVEPLMDSLKRQPELWEANPYWKNNFRPKVNGVDVIMLRYPDLSQADQRAAMDYAHYEFLPEARPLISGLMALVNGQRLGGCFIDRLMPGGFIAAHRDPPTVSEYYDRFHIALTTNENATFRAGDDVANMGSGEIWWFDLKQEHEARNDGATERIHLIVDIRLPA